MTFQGDKIVGKPTLLQIVVYISEKGLCVDPSYVYSYWETKGWLTKKGCEVKTLEAAINVVNGLYIEKLTRKMTNKSFEGIPKDRNERIENKKAIKTKIREIKIKAKELSHDANQLKPYIKYEDQLKDARWLAFRTFIKKVRGEKCEICGSTRNLQVHHTHYNKNCKAWEYTCNEVIVVCKDCHQKIHKKI